MSNKNKPEIAFRLIRITTEEFAVFRKNYDRDIRDFEMGLSVELNAYRKNHLIELSTHFTFSQEGSPLLLLKSSCHFRIVESYWELIENGREIIIPPGFATHLLVIAVGTARGIIHAKKPAWLENLLLTTVDISEIFEEEEIYIELSDEE